MSKLLALAGSHGFGWVRVEPGSEWVLEEMKKQIPRQARNDQGKVSGGEMKIVKAPHDMQPMEAFVVDITKSEEELLAGMKSKTRYNVRLAEKKGVRVFQSIDEKYRRAFVELVTGTADRKGIVPHPRTYYEKMLGVLLGERATLFVAEHEGDILGVNLMVFFGDTATYLHGGSADVKREYMAPFLLQWEAMKDAKRRGCTRYDFGGVKTGCKMQDARCRMSDAKDQRQETGDKEQKNGSKNHASLIMHHTSGDWAGITRFKTGFSPSTAPTVFPGCHDIVLSPSRYFLYQLLSVVLSHAAGIRKSVGV